MKKRQKVLILMSVGSILFNVLVGNLVSTVLAIPLLFMDSVGTVFISVYGGMPYGIVVGILTNLLKAVIGGRPSAAYFAVVSVAIAVVSALMARKRFGLDKAILTGFLLSIVSALVSIPIRLILLGGYTGSGTDAIMNAMLALGSEVFSAAFFSAVTSNLVDKLLTCFMVWGVIHLLPPNLLRDTTELQKPG